MFRDAEEELQRLEEELLSVDEEEELDEEEYDEDEEEYEEYDEDFDEEDFDEEEDDEDFEEEDEVIQPVVKGYKVYNSDHCDVNLDRYSEDVYRGRRSGCLAWVFAGLTVALLAVLYLYLKQGGYL